MFCLLPVVNVYASQIKRNTAKHKQFTSSKLLNDKLLTFKFIHKNSSKISKKLFCDILVTNKEFPKCLKENIIKDDLPSNFKYLWYKSGNSPKKENFFSLIEKVYKLKNYDEWVSLEYLQETLWKAYNDPINLNNPDLQDLIDLSILSSKQIQALISHINNFGPLISIYELNIIPEFNKKIIILLMSFVKVVPTKSIIWGSYTNTKRSYIYLRYKPYPKNTDKKPDLGLGSLFSLRLKTKINLPYNVKIGFLAEKKPYEAFICDPNTNRYFFNSFSASLEIADTLYIGDYQFGFGQGIISSEGFYIKKILEPTDIIRCQKGLCSYQSLYTYTFYRGIASTIKYKDLNFTFLFSNINQDATIKGLLTKSTKKDKDPKLPIYASSTPKDIIYDNINKLKNKGTLKEKVYGTSIIYNKKEENNPFSTGIAFLYKTLNPPVLGKKRKDFEYIFRGNVNINYSYFCTLHLNNICFFSEWAYSVSKIYKNNYSTHMKEYFLYNKNKSDFSKSGANIVGAIVAINKKCDLGVLFRNYGPYFHSIRGNSYAQQQQQNRNEKGFVINNKIKPVNNAIFDHSIDIFWFPYCRYHFSKPSKGIEYRSKLEYIFNKKHLTIFSFNFKNKDKEISIGRDKIKILDKQKSILLKICHKWKINTKISTKSHMQASFVKMPDTKKNLSNIEVKYTYSRSNFLLAQDIEYKFTKLTTRLRLALFNIGNKQESMLYLHENGPLYYSTMPPSYKNIGHKAYILITYKPVPTLRLDFKYDISRICPYIKNSSSKTVQTFIMQAAFSF